MKLESLLTVHGDGFPSDPVSIDTDELARRLRAFLAAMQLLQPHATTIKMFLVGLDDVVDAQQLDETIVGSVGWWAAVIVGERDLDEWPGRQP